MGREGCGGRETSAHSDGFTAPLDSTLDSLNLPQQEQHSGSRTAQHSDDDNGDSSVTTTSAPDARLAHPLLHPHSSRPLSLPRQHLRLPPHGSQCTTPPSAASYHANSSTAPSLAPTTGLPRDFVIALNSRMFKLHTASRRLKDDADVRLDGRRWNRLAQRRWQRVCSKRSIRSSALCQGRSCSISSTCCPPVRSWRFAVYRTSFYDCPGPCAD